MAVLASASSVTHFNHGLNLYRDIQGQRVAPHCAAGMDTLVTKHLHQEIRSTVHHLRISREYARTHHDPWPTGHMHSHSHSNANVQMAVL